MIAQVDQEESSFTAVIERATETLLSFSVPLYFSERGRPVLFGTGFFVRAGLHHFFVSAAHVLDRAIDLGLFFYASPDVTCRLSGKLFRSGQAEQRKRDQIDLGVLKISFKAVPPYPDVGKFSVDVSSLRPKHLPRTGKHYIIIGFPANKSKIDETERTVLARPYAFRSDPIDDSAYRGLGLSSETHVVLPFNRKRGFDPGGKITQFPRPHGMSGAPIVVLYENDDDSRVFPVVAVGIEYRESRKALIGTDISFAMDLMRNAT